MDGERLGPLSYDVTAPEGEASAQRAILLGVAAIVGLMVVGLVGGWFALGFVEAATLLTNAATLAILLVPVFVAFTASRESIRRTRRTALVVVTALSLLAALFTGKLLGNVKAAMPQVRTVVDAIDLPPGFTQIDSEEFGDRLCRRGCPTIERRYQAPANDPDPVSTLILAMFDQGWELTSDVEPRFATVAAKDGLFAQLAENDPHVVELRVTRQG